METSPAYVHTVRALYDAFARRDRVLMDQLVDPEIEWTSAENFIYADHSPYIGTDAVAHLIFERLLIDWDNFSMAPTEILGGGDVVIASGRFRGKFRATGATINAQFVQVFQFKDGRISKCQMYTDTAQFKDAINHSRLASA